MIIIISIVLCVVVFILGCIMGTTKWFDKLMKDILDK